MVDAVLDKPLRMALRLNEIGDASPYQLSFAGKGKSGASFGFMQGDLAAKQPVVTTAFHAVLQAAGFIQAEIVSFSAELSVPLLACPLSGTDRIRINAALLTNQTLVDAMDENILSNVYVQLDMCTAAANKNGITIDPKASIYMALWINMTGPPTMLLTWLGGGTPALAQPVPAALNPVDGPAMETYLQATDYFVENRQNFPHLMQCAAAGAAMLLSPP